MNKINSNDIVYTVVTPIPSHKDGWFRSVDDDPVCDTTMETTHLAGPPVLIKGERLTDKITVEIRNATDFSSLMAASGPGPTDEEQRLERENARLRTELTHAKAMASAAAADTAMVRQSLRLVLDQHDEDCRALERRIEQLTGTITAQAQDIERLVAAAVAKEYAEPVSDKVPERTDDDWIMPGGLPRGVR